MLLLLLPLSRTFLVHSSSPHAHIRRTGHHGLTYPLAGAAVGGALDGFAAASRGGKSPYPLPLRGRSAAAARCMLAGARLGDSLRPVAPTDVAHCKGTRLGGHTCGIEEMRMDADAFVMERLWTKSLARINILWQELQVATAPSLLWPYLL